MGSFGPFHDPWHLAAQVRAQRKLEPMAEENDSFSEVMWEIGLVLVSALAVAAIVGELLERFHVS